MSRFWLELVCLMKGQIRDWPPDVLWLSPDNFSEYLLLEYQFTEWLSEIALQWQRLTGARMRLQHLVKIKMTLLPVSRVASCMHKFLWKLLSFITVCEDFKSKYRQRWDSRKSEGWDAMSFWTEEAWPHTGKSSKGKDVSEAAATAVLANRRWGWIME